jgi:U4/U6 small nuclear ribonucleoprotein PRP4
MAAEHENPNSSNLPAESSAFVTDDELMIDNTSPIPLAIPPSIPAVPPNARLCLLML